MITYQYAQSDDGASWNIADVSDEYRKQHRFTCFGCGNRMSAVLGKNREIHFRHYQECACSKETYLHKLGKQKFLDLYYENRAKGIPLTIEFQQEHYCDKKGCPFNAKRPCEAEPTNEDFYILPNYSICEVEPFDPETNLRPDVLLKDADGKKLYIEIAVTHESTENKIASGIPILEFFLIDESDLARFSLEKKNGSFSSIDRTIHRFYNVEERSAPVEKFCISSIERAKEKFKSYYEMKVGYGHPINLFYCEKEKCKRECPFFNGEKCSINNDVPPFNLTSRFTKIIDEEPDSPNLYLLDGNGTKICINFAIENAIPDLSGLQERIIQFVFSMGNVNLPWEYRNDTFKEGYDIRFYNFKRPSFPKCEDFSFRVFILYKDGMLFDSAKTLNIFQIFEKVKMDYDEIVDYLLIDPSFGEIYFDETNFHLFLTVAYIFSKHSMYVKNCFFCAYCHDNSNTKCENIYCYKQRGICSAKESCLCKDFQLGKYDHMFFGHSLGNNSIEKAAFENRLKLEE